MTSTLDKPKTTLWSLALESQEIDGQLAIAYDLISSEDPEERAQGETLITELLQTASANQALFKEKLNGLCHIREQVLGKAAHLRNLSKAWLEKAEAAEKQAESLLAYATRVLEATNPGQKKFELPEFTISSRASEAVDDETLNADVLPSNLTRAELRFRVHGATSATIRELEEAINQLLHEWPTPLTIDWSETKVAADKPAIKTALKAGLKVPGAQLIKRRNWSVK